MLLIKQCPNQIGILSEYIRVFTSIISIIASLTKIILNCRPTCMDPPIIDLQLGLMDTV